MFFRENKKTLENYNPDFWDGGELPLMIKNFPIVICWTPKSGCTTVLKWFLEQNSLLEKAYEFNPWVHEYREKILYNQIYKKECRKIFEGNTSGKFIIKVIRNPIKRSVSSYLHFLRFGKISKNWPVVQKIESWKKENGLASQSGLSFRQFLNFVICQKISGGRNDTHFESQYNKIQDPKVDIFIPIEKISSEIPKIEKEFNLKKIDINELSKSGHNNQSTDSHRWPQDASSFPADHDFNIFLGTPPCEIFLDSETKLLIKNAYWCDFNAYSSCYNININ